MSATQYVEYILREEWSTDVPGRVHQVPQPTILMQNRDEKKIRDRSGDSIVVMDGGVEGHTPSELGGGAKDIDSLVTIEMRTSHSLERFEGARDDNNDMESWGGLRGEVERILGRHDFENNKEFSYVIGEEWRDQRSQVQWGHYKGSWEVRLAQVGADFNPPAGL